MRREIPAGLPHKLGTTRRNLTGGSDSKRIPSSFTILNLTAVPRLQYAESRWRYPARHIYCSHAQFSDHKFWALPLEPGMQTSNYLKRVLFHQLNHGTDQYLESKSEALFQRPGKESFIEVYYQQPRQQGFPSPVLALDDEEASESEWTPVTSFFLDRSCCGSLDDARSTHNNWLRHDIRDLKGLEQIDSVSTSMAVLKSYANTQRNQGNQTLFPRVVSESSMPAKRNLS